ncbi:chemotaxis protein CheD [Halobacteriales archaeon QS_1_68_20]|nr:MAG: chemotaxis protein CheD [Halobacteriales archaeon QS_1_68_20]
MRTYGADSDQSDRASVEVGIAEYAVTDDGEELSTFGLGSCVAVVLYDDDAGVAGLAHVMLPTAGGSDGESPGKFADTAVAAMVREMEERGADADDMEAKLAGGSEMFEFTGIAQGVGQRNVEAAREALQAKGIPIEAEDVGGEHGRSVRLNGEIGAVELKTADNEREEL